MIRHECIFHPNGNIKYFKEYDNNILFIEENFNTNGELHGLSRYKNWENFGYIFVEKNYKNNKPHGLCYIYLNENLLNKFTYKNGLKHGKYKTYYENGQKFTEENYKNNKLHGLRTVYLQNGEIHSKINYSNGKPI